MKRSLHVILRLHFLKVLTFVCASNLLSLKIATAQITQITGSPQTVTTTGTTLTITKPSGLAIGDVMIANIVQSDGDNSPLNDALLSGWTEIDGRDIGSSGNDHWRGTLLYKLATSSDVNATNFAFTLDNDANGDGSVGAITAFRGVDIAGGYNDLGTPNSGPFDVDPGIINTSGNTNVVTSVSITTVTANAAVIMFGMLGNDRNFSNWQTATSPGTLNELYDVKFNTQLDNGIGAAWAIKATAGSTGAGTANLTGSARNGAILIALKPAPPTITGFSPSNACTGSATSVIISGTNFTGASAVTFNGVSASYSVDSSIQITATLPAAATSGKINITTPQGAVESSENFTVNTLPAVSITGSSVICAGGTTSLSPTTGGTWISSDTGIATVTNGGIVTGVSAGNTSFTFTETSTGCSNTTSAITVNPVPSISSQPSGVSVLDGSSTSFSVTANNVTSYQWQVSTNGGANWSDISNGGVYSNATAATLNISNVSGLNGNQYRCVLTNTCGTTTSDVAEILIDVDTDGDGITDSDDLDDDNDGVTDIAELSTCNSGSLTEGTTLFSESFGTGTRASTAYTNYCYEDGSGSCPGTGYNNNLNDGEYSILRDSKPFSVNYGAADFPLWISSGDHTGDTNGRMIVFNAAITPGEFYRRTIAVEPNVPIMVSFWVLNLMGSGTDTKPDIFVRLQTTTGDLIAATTGEIPQDQTWHEFTFTSYCGNINQAELILINNAVGGSGNDLAIDDILFKIGQDCDSDNDGVPDRIDLDSDNDGIYDVTEAGGTATSSGRINGFTDANGDGSHDTTLADPDTDSDGSKDRIDLDADADGCNDVLEAGFADGDSNGILGSNPVTVNSDGVVTSGTGYTAPADIDSNSVYDFQQYSLQPSITAHPTSQSVNPGENAVFTVVGVADEFRWQVNTGSGFSDITDGATYSGTTTSSLTVIAPNSSFSGYQYRVVLSSPSNTCVAGALDSNPANLLVISADNDSDGVGNDVDIDDDNDGIADTVEGATDTDGDGLSDWFDLDSDNDGIYDILEAGGTDTDFNGLADSFADVNGNGLTDVYDPACDGSTIAIRASATAGTNGTVSNSGNAVDASQTTYATISDGAILDLDFGTSLPSGTIVTVYLSTAFNSFNSSGSISRSSDDITYSQTQAYTVNTQPATGNAITYTLAADARYIRISRAGQTNSNTRVHMATYNTIVCNGTIGATIPDTDSDSDSNKDRIETDSDNDGCSDVKEAGFSDSDSDGKLDGTGLGANGAVTGNTDGYTSPADANSNSVYDYREANSAAVGGSVSGGTAICFGSASGILTLSGHTGTVTKWQYSTDSSNWTDIANTLTTYTSGTLTQTTQFRAMVQSNVCNSANSSATTVTVNPTSVAGTASAVSNPVCYNSSTTLALSGYTGSIQWQTNASGSWTNISGAVSDTYVTPNLTTATSYRAVVTSGVCSSETSNEVIITIDNIAPVFTGCPSDFTQNIDTGYCSALVSWTAPTVTDNCGGTPTVTVSLGSGGTFSGGSENEATITVGTTTVTYSATDAAGNVSTCSFEITVHDQTAPTIACPPGQTVFCAGNIPVINTLPLFIAAGGTYSDNSGSDCNMVSVAYTDNQVGNVVTRTYTIVDGGSNQATCQQIFTISQPTVTISSLGLDNTCPGGELTINSVVSGTVHYQWQVSTDNGSNWSDTGTDNATFTGTLANLGDQYRLLVSQTTDFSQTGCNAISNVLTFQDVTKPVFTSFAPANQTVCTVNGATTTTVSGIRIDNVDVTDNCTAFASLNISYSISGATAGNGVNLTEGTSFNTGSSTVIYTVTDQSGNTETHTFTITVNQSPADISLSSAVVSGGGTGIAPNQCGEYRYDVTEDASAPEAGYTYTWKVYTGAGTGGTQLTAGTDYVIDNSTSPYHAASVKITWPGSLASGTYTIEVIKAGGNGCDSRSSLLIDLQNSFNLFVNDPGQDCKGESLGSKIINWEVGRNCGTTAYSFKYVIAAGDYNTLAEAQANAIAGMPVTVTNTTDNPYVILQTVDYGTGGDFYTTQIFTLFIYDQLDGNGQPDMNTADNFQKFYLKAIPNTSEISTD